MKNLQEATERICELKGSLIALDALLPALLDTLTPAVREAMLRSFDAHAEAARTVMLHTDISDHVLASFERDVARTRTMLPGATRAQRRPDPCATASAAVLLTTTRIGTFVGPRLLSRASGFFFRRDGCLFLVMSRHVVADESSSHYPDRIEIDVHTDAQDLTQHAIVSIPLCRDGLRLWRQNADDAEPVDVAVIAIESDRLPEQAVLHAFDATHLESDGDGVAIGDAVSVIGFPFGFDDTVHPPRRRARRRSCIGPRRALPAARLLPDRRQGSPRQQWRACPAAPGRTSRRRLAAALAVARGAFDTRRRPRVRPDGRSVARLRLRLVRGRPLVVDRIASVSGKRAG